MIHSWEGVESEIKYEDPDFDDVCSKSERSS